VYIRTHNLFTTGDGTNDAGAPWDGTFLQYNEFPPGTFGPFGDFDWVINVAASVPGGGGTGRSQVGVIGFNYVANNDQAVGGGPGFFYCVIAFSITNSPGFIVWAGKGPVDAGWTAGPANTADVAGTYVRFDNGPSNLTGPASLVIELF